MSGKWNINNLQTPSCSSACSKTLSGFSTPFAPDWQHPQNCYLQFSPFYNQKGGLDFHNWNGDDKWCKKQKCGKDNCGNCTEWAATVAQCNNDDLNYWCANCGVSPPPPAPTPGPSSGKCCAYIDPIQQFWCDQQPQNESDCKNFTLPIGGVHPCVWRRGATSCPKMML